MSNVSMQLIKELRERTQAGMSDCKSALAEAEGNIEAAVEIILKKGLAKSAKRAGAVASEGLVATKVEDTGLNGVILEVNIQTDFAARNPDFLAFAAQVLETAAAAPTGADIAEQPLAGGAGTVEDNRKALVGKLGENVTVRRWARVSVGNAGLVHSYVHMGGKIAVLLGLKVSDESIVRSPSFVAFADDTAMQIAAMTPLFVAAEQADPAVVAKQREIYTAQLIEEGKPEGVVGKIVDGKVQKWLKEVALLEQPSIVHDSTIDELRAALSKELGAEISISSFVRYERGEGVEKSTDNFAEEAQRMATGG